jgi:predicted branched-subunit amino acid permease
MDAVVHTADGRCPPSTRRGRMAPAIEGARDITPMVIGVIPFALAIGGAIGASSLSSAEGAFSAIAILAGSAQLATINMLDGGVSPTVVVASAILINARILLYSAALAPWFSDLRLGRRLLLALPVIDQLHFTCSPRFERGDLDSSARTAYYIGAATWLVSAWVLTQVTAIMVGASMPDSLGLEIAAPLALAGLLAKSATTAATTAASATGFVIAVACVATPMHSSVLIAMLAGMAVGRWTERLTVSHHDPTEATR